MLAQGDESPGPDAEARRVATDRFLGSDSLLLTLVNGGVAQMRSEGTRFDETAREIRSLAGQRAAYLSGRRTDELAAVSRLEVYVTVKDAIIYLLLFAAPEAEYAGHQALFDRVRASLVLAPGAETSASR
jgi:hypothetical protein